MATGEEYLWYPPQFGLFAKYVYWYVHIEVLNTFGWW